MLPVTRYWGVKGHPNVLVQSRGLLAQGSTRTPETESRALSGNPTFGLCLAHVLPPADPPSSHVVRQADTRSCPSGIKLCQPCVWALWGTAPPAAARTREFTFDTSPGCQHLCGTILAWETEWTEVTVPWGKKEGDCVMAMNFANGSESRWGLSKPVCETAAGFRDHRGGDCSPGVTC